MFQPSPRALASAALALFLAAPVFAEPLALERVLAEVAAANPSLAASRHESTAAWARARRAGAWDAPMLELAAENVPVTGGFDQDPMTMKVVGLEQKVDLFGARGLARHAAEGDARAAEAQRKTRAGSAWAMRGARTPTPTSPAHAPTRRAITGR